MAQPLKQSVPGLAAAHLAAFTTVSAAPELHASVASPRTAYAPSQVVYPQWWRSPAIVLRGWRPRSIEMRKPWQVRLAGAAAALFGRLAEWHERSRGRRILLTFDDYQLKDIGLDRASARREAELPFWRG